MEKIKLAKDKSISFILIALGILSLVSIVTAFKFFMAEKMIYKTYIDMENKSKAENSKITEEIAGLNQERDNLKDKLTVSERELKRLEQEVTSSKMKYESLVKERENLIAESNALLQAKASLEEKVKAMESNEFLAALIRVFSRAVVISPSS